MAIIAGAHLFVFGVGTRARNHVLAILAANGQLIDTCWFPVTKAGMAHAVARATRLPEQTQGSCGPSNTWPPTAPDSPVP